MLWCTELDTAENFGLTSIQKPLIAISKCPLLNIHPVFAATSFYTSSFFFKQRSDKWHKITIVKT